MEPSKVYFTDMHAAPGSNLLQKLDRLLRAAGLAKLELDGKFVAIKMHFGEPGNLSYLRPNYAKVVADLVKESGGVPFLTDCNTLYAGSRKNAIDHLKAAAENGFTPETTGCPVLIADGLLGLDEALVPLTGTKHVKEAKLGRAIVDADVLISLSHFKGHEMTGFGGAIKNLGMGCGSRAGKMEQHRGGKPCVDASVCRGCHKCAKYCGQNAISYGTDNKAFIDEDACVGCGHCIAACTFDAIDNPHDSTNAALCEKMAEYALAAVQGKPAFHINIAAQISPHCDCWGCNDIPIIPDVGMFASFDPVALDMAAADACNRAPAVPDSALSAELAAHGDAHHDHFTNIFPDTDWRVALDHAEEVGVGTKRYELIAVK